MTVKVLQPPYTREREIMDAVEFLEQYKLMCGQFNCKDGCPIKRLRDKHGIDVCDDVFIYLHPIEVVSAVQDWSKESRRSIEQAKIDAQLELLAEQAKESNVMYYPQVEGITPTVI